MDGAYTIESYVSETRNWEPVPEGDFENLCEAMSAMQSLEQVCGWRNLRIVRSSTSHREPVCYGRA